jgi:hypothetical protein
VTVATPQSAVGLAEAWIYARLSGDSQLASLGNSPLLQNGVLRVYAGVAPEGAAYPLITYQGISGQDLTTPGYHRVFTTFEYDVHCADRVGSIVGLDAIAARVDALLHGQEAYPFDSGAYEVSCRRLRIVPLSGQVAGVATRELILSFEIIVQEAGDV